MKRSLVLGIPPSSALDMQGFVDLAAVVRGMTSIDLRPVELPSYATLFDAVDQGACDAAWAPPLVALDLESSGSARALAVLERDGGTTYYAVLVSKAGSGFTRLADLARARVGWVAPQSAAGYVVPRLHLASLGFGLRGGFAREAFLGSHAAAARALVRGDVDVIATHASFAVGGTTLVPAEVGVKTHLIAGAGPIPSDVLVAREGVPHGLVDALAWALGALGAQPGGLTGSLSRIRGFARVPATHLDALRRLKERAEGGTLRAFTPRAEGVAL